MIPANITFTESESPEYKPRTVDNASADVTLAFALDFTTRGEKLTKSSAEAQGIYCALEVLNLASCCKKLSDLAESLKQRGKTEVTVNIAGNGIYTLHKYGWSQDDIDWAVAHCLGHFQQFLAAKDIKIILVRSGGQTGADEAGAKASSKLGIPTLVHSPKGFRMRIIEKDIFDETLFKARFDVK